MPYATIKDVDLGPAPELKPPEPGLFSAAGQGLDSGVRSAGAMATGIGGRLAESYGFRDTAKSLYASAAEQEEHAAAVGPAIDTFQKAQDGTNGVRDYWDYGTGLLAKGGPMIAAGILGGALARGGTASRILGASAATLPFTGGQQILSQQADPVQAAKSVGLRNAVAGGVGAAQAVGYNVIPQVMGGRLFGAAEKAVYQGTGKIVAKNVGEAVGGNALAGIAGEALNQQAGTFLNENRDTSQDAANMKEAIAGSVVGGLPFAGIGIAGEKFHNRRLPRPGGIDLDAGKPGKPGAPPAVDPATGAPLAPDGGTPLGPDGGTPLPPDAGIAARASKAARDGINAFKDVVNRKSRSEPTDLDAAERVARGEDLVDEDALAAATQSPEAAAEVVNKGVAATGERVQKWADELATRNLSPENKAKFDEAMADFGSKASNAKIAAVKFAEDTFEATVEASRGMGRAFDEGYKTARKAPDEMAKARAREQGSDAKDMGPVEYATDPERLRSASTADGDLAVANALKEVTGDARVAAATASDAAVVLQAMRKGARMTPDMYEKIVDTYGPDAPDVLAGVHDQVFPNPTRASEEFAKALAGLSEHVNAKKSLDEMVLSSALPEYADELRPRQLREIINGIRGHVRGQHTAGHGPVATAAQEARFKIRMHEVFGDKTDDVIARFALEAEQESAKLSSDRPWGENGEPLDVTQSEVDARQRQADAEETQGGKGTARNKDGERTEDFRDTFEQPHYVGGGHSPKNPTFFISEEAHHRDYGDVNPNDTPEQLEAKLKKTPARKKLEEVRKKFPDHNVDYITAKDYATEHGLTDEQMLARTKQLPDDHVMIEVSGQKLSNRLSAAEMDSIKLDTRNFGESKNRIDTSVDGVTLDAQRLMKVMRGKMDLDWDDASSGDGMVRMARVFFNGIAAATHAIGGKIGLHHDGLVVGKLNGREVTLKELKAVRTDTAAKSSEGHEPSTETKQQLENKLGSLQLNMERTEKRIARREAQLKKGPLSEKDAEWHKKDLKNLEWMKTEEPRLEEQLKRRADRVDVVDTFGDQAGGLPRGKLELREHEGKIASLEKELKDAQKRDPSALYTDKGETVGDRLAKSERELKHLRAQESLLKSQQAKRAAENAPEIKKNEKRIAELKTELDKKVGPDYVVTRESSARDEALANEFDDLQQSNRVLKSTNAKRLQVLEKSIADMERRVAHQKQYGADKRYSNDTTITAGERVKRRQDEITYMRDQLPALRALAEDTAAGSTSDGTGRYAVGREDNIHEAGKLYADYNEDGTERTSQDLINKPVKGKIGDKVGIRTETGPDRMRVKDAKGKETVVPIGRDTEVTQLGREAIEGRIKGLETGKSEALRVVGDKARQLFNRFDELGYSDQLSLLAAAEAVTHTGARDNVEAARLINQMAARRKIEPSKVYPGRGKGPKAKLTLTDLVNEGGDSLKRVLDRVESATDVKALQSSVDELVKSQSKHTRTALEAINKRLDALTEGNAQAKYDLLTNRGSETMRSEDMGSARMTPEERAASDQLIKDMVAAAMERRKNAKSETKKAAPDPTPEELHEMAQDTWADEHDTIESMQEDWAADNGQTYVKKPYVREKFDPKYPGGRSDGPPARDIPFSNARVDPARDLNAKYRKVVEDHIEKVLGKSVEVEWHDFLHAGDFTKRSGDPAMPGVKDLIRLSIHALDPTSVASHEALHGFISQLRQSGDHEINKVLFKAADQEAIKKQLRDYYHDQPEVLKQIDGSSLHSAEERVAYMYQLWTQGKLTVGPKTETMFGKIAKLIRGVLGIWSNDQKALHIMKYFQEGDYAKNMGDRMKVRSDLNQGRNEHIDTFNRITKPLQSLASSMAGVGEGRLRSLNNPALNRLADLVHTGTSREAIGGDTGYVNASRVQHSRFINELSKGLRDIPQEHLDAALEAMQTGKTPTHPQAVEAQKAVRKSLDTAYKHMKDAGVDLGNLGPDYFPRVWDTMKLTGKQKEFKAMLQKYKDSGDLKGSVESVMARLITGEGSELGVETLTPGMQHAKERILGFITPEDAAPFLDKSLHKTMNGYLSQAARRSEWARRFSDDNSTLRGIFKAAEKDGATSEDLALARKYLNGVNGTLGDHINPSRRKLFANAIVYENVRLLSLGIFSSAPDAAGIFVRGGTVSDAFSTWKRGIGEISRGLKKAENQKFDPAYQLSEDLGVIENAMLQHTVGSAYSQDLHGWSKKVNEGFFKYNLMDQYNRSMRVGATVAAAKFLAKHGDGTHSTHSTRWLGELGLKAGDVEYHKTGALTRAGESAGSRDPLLTHQDFIEAGYSVEEAAAKSNVMAAAVNKWVDGAVLRPNAAQKPIWFNDPHFAIISHLKQFTYSFQENILKRVINEAKHGNYTPALGLASYIPVMLAADCAKGMIIGGGSQPDWKAGWGPSDYMWAATQRAGLFGVGQFGIDAVSHRSGLVGLLGPTIEQLGQGLSVAGGTERFGSFALKSMPANALAGMFASSAESSPAADTLPIGTD